MNTFLKDNKIISKWKRKALVLAVSTITITLVSTSLTQASDIQIYQNPSATNYPILMLAIDNSSSMSAKDTTYKGATVSRLDALKGSLKDALNAKNIDGNYKIPSHAYIGLSIFTGSNEAGTTPDWLSSGDGRSSKILVEAKQLDSAHRADLILKINGISAGGSTPTPLLLAETYAYLLGSRTDGNNLATLNSTASSLYSNYSRGLSGKSLAPLGTQNTAGEYIAPLTKLRASDAQCSAQGVFFLTDGAPVGIRPATALPIMKNTLADTTFTCENSPLSDVYYNYSTAKTNATSAVTWNGEFKEMASKAYLLANGKTIDENGASGSSQVNWQNRSSWSCVGKLVSVLANKTEQTADARQKRIYTSTVGFGPLFKKHAHETCTDTNADGRPDYCTYDQTYTGSTNGWDISNQMNAKALEILGNDIGTGPTANTDKPIGGYKYAESGEDIQAALENFLNAVGNSSFETASFGTYIVPTDPLATTSSYNYVFAPQFQPKVNTVNTVTQSTQQLWLGNLKKYKISSSGTLIDANNATLLNDKGAVHANTKDFWNISGVADGDSALKGGLSSRLMIPNFDNALLNTVTNVAEIKTRPLYTDAMISTSGDGAHKLVDAKSLTKLTSSNVLDATFLESDNPTLASKWRRNTYQPYLLSALGYKLTSTDLNALSNGYVWDNVNKVKNLNVMQQMGGVIHSDPLLVTLEGKYHTTTGEILENTDTTVNRKDYIIAGTLQGLLHMVDQSTGKEVFSFLPNEIVQDPIRRDALLEASNTQSSTVNPLYGIDAPWASWVAYKINPTQNKFEANIANIYGGMRMGGSSYYGLNIKNPTSPEFLFQIDPITGKIKSSSSDVSSSVNSAIQAMGQSWSKPTLVNIRFGNEIKKVMIVGGGYDSAYESATYQPTSVTTASPNKGAGVYIFDAQTGALLWSARAGIDNLSSTDVRNANLKYSVVSQIKAFDRDADGLVDNLYFGDLGGQVFRVDLNNAYDVATTSFGRVNRIADFSSLNQRFYEMPALSIHDRNGKRFGVISIASGNRSFPLNQNNGSDNRIYALYDHDIASTQLFQSDFAKTSNLTESDLLNWAQISATNVVQLTSNTKKGWYYILRKTKTTDETINTGTVKALNGYLVVANTAKFSDLYVSLYNPNHASSQQPNSCQGGITGSNIVKQLCLPYGVCAADDDASLSNASNYQVGNREHDSTPRDGITDVQAGGFKNGDGKNLLGIIPSAGKHYKTSKVFQSSNWFER